MSIIKMIFLIILINAYLTHAINNNQEDRLCILKKYKKNNNKELECPSNKCEHEYSYSCGPNYCASDETMCILLTRNKISSLKSYINSELNENKICKNGKNCHRKSKIPMRSGTSLKILKPIDCPCNQKFSFQCGLDYCAIDKHECDRFKAKIVLNDHLKKCGNENIII
jgi:hypothetical protein